MLPQLPADARLYLRPTWFAPSPVGLADGSAARMGNGLIWFQAYELTARKDGRRVARATVPVAEFADAIAGLPDTLAERARLLAAHRSEERSVGNECVSTGRYRWWPYHSKTNKKS